MKKIVLITIISLVVLAGTSALIGWKSWKAWTGDLESDIKMSMPSAGGQVAADTLAIKVMQDGSVFLGDEQIDKAQLGESLSLIDPAEPIVLYGDRDTDFQKFAEVMDICTRAGLWNISFATGKNATEPGSHNLIHENK